MLLNCRATALAVIAPQLKDASTLRAGTACARWC